MKSFSVPVGSLAPDFTLPCASGGTQTLSGHRGEQVVVLFYRGHWCGSCRAQLEDVRRYAVIFQDRGAKVLAISAEPLDQSQKAVVTYGLAFDVLSDPELTVVDRYGVRHLGEPDGRAIARPSLFLVDQAGVVRFAHVGEDADDRPSMALILLALESMAV